MFVLQRAEQPLSDHFKMLVDAGILTRNTRGKWAYDALIPGALGALATILSTRSIRATA